MIHNHRRAMLLTGVLLALAPLAHGAVSDVIKIQAGQQRSYHHDQPIHRVAVGNPEIANLTVISVREVLITAKQPGSTSFTLWHGKRSANPDFSGLILVTAADRLAGHSLSALNAPDLSVSEAGAKLKLSGASASLESHAHAVQAFDDKAGSTVDESTLGFDAQVQIDLKIVEVSRNKMKDAGLFLGRNTRSSTLALSTPGNLSGVDATDGAFTLLSNSGFLPQLQAFNFVYGNASKGILGVISAPEGNGFAYTLAEPSLVAMSGQSANFLAGGEFPIPVRSGIDAAITIEYKEFGVRLTLTPTVLDPQRIMLKVAPEVSELDFTAGVQSGGVSVPALRIRRTDTSVALGDGESFVISGLISQNTLTNVDKVPGLGNIPILGAFFRSTRLERDDRELLMVVTPHLVRPLARGAQTPPLPGAQYRDYDPDFFQLISPGFLEKGDFGTAGKRVSGFSD
jgi:Flp pilus assembly protein, secretin CpaC